MFEYDFYPTPRQVVEQMLSYDDIHGYTFLEPSAGSGNIVDYLNDMGAEKVLACEIDDKLRKILYDKCDVIRNDFLNLKAEDVSFIDCIVMNPPFSDGWKHLQHAWNIAPDGCRILSLFNSDSLESSFGNSETKTIIENYGFVTEFGQCFKNAEVRTNVNISLIELNKPILSGNRDYIDYASFYMNEERHEDVPGIMKYFKI